MEKLFRDLACVCKRFGGWGTSSGENFVHRVHQVSLLGDKHPAPPLKAPPHRLGTTSVISSCVVWDEKGYLC